MCKHCSFKNKGFSMESSETAWLMTGCDLSVMKLEIHHPTFPVIPIFSNTTPQIHF